MANLPERNLYDDIEALEKFQVLNNKAVFRKGKALIFAPAGLIRPAPAELPQDRKIARVGGCSGAM
jgi:hypothetical protein